MAGRTAKATITNRPTSSATYFTRTGESSAPFSSCPATLAGGSGRLPSKARSSTVSSVAARCVESHCGLRQRGQVAQLVGRARLPHGRAILASRAAISRSFTTMAAVSRRTFPGSSTMCRTVFETPYVPDSLLAAVGGDVSCGYTGSRPAADVLGAFEAVPGTPAATGWLPVVCSVRCIESVADLVGIVALRGLLGGRFIVVERHRGAHVPCAGHRLERATPVCPPKPARRSVALPRRSSVPAAGYPPHPPALRDPASDRRPPRPPDCGLPPARHRPG